jgi:branched-chain amino acid transport system substrate-binding protein
MRGCVGALSALVIFLLSAGCATVERRPVEIAALYNLSGAQKNLDVPSSEGARLAVAQANAAGGVLERPVALRLIDGRTEPKRIAAETEALFEETPDVAGLIGFSDTDMVLASAPVAAKHGRVFLTSGATSPRLPAQVPEYLFLACFGDNVQAAAGAEWAYRTRNARTVAVLFNEGTAYTRLLHGYFETRYKELGGTVLSVQPYRLKGFKVNFETLRKADLVYLSAYPDDVTTVIPLLRKAGVTAPILGGDGLDIGTAWQAIPATRDVYFTTHAYLGADNPDPAVRRFRKLYAEAHPGKEPDAFTALGYDAAGLLMSAIERAASAAPDAVRQALAATRDYRGVTGTIGYRGGSRIPAKSVTIMRVDGGRQTFVGSVLPQSIPAP